MGAGWSWYLEATGSNSQGWRKTEGRETERQRDKAWLGLAPGQLQALTGTYKIGVLMVHSQLQALAGNPSPCHTRLECERVQRHTCALSLSLSAASTLPQTLERQKETHTAPKHLHDHTCTISKRYPGGRPLHVFWYYSIMRLLTHNVF